MTKRQDLGARIEHLTYDELTAFLDENSGLPGPRGNIELAMAVADVAGPEAIMALCGEDDEFRKTCGATGLGALLIGDNYPAEQQAHALACSDMWRVREGVAMALQHVGDTNPARMRQIVAAWAVDPHPLVRRAAIAGICEPRLLTDPLTASAALAACQAATTFIAASPAHQRRDADMRTLRQALGYCWSVAVAGDPTHGLPAFQALGEQAETSRDADIAWIVKTNLTKKRLARLL